MRAPSNHQANSFWLLQVVHDITDGVIFVVLISPVFNANSLLHSLGKPSSITIRNIGISKIDIPNTMANNKDRAEGLRINELYDAQLVTIFVGRDRRRFSVLRPIICDLSDYFRKAFEGSFIEGQTGVITLLDVDEWVFECFTIWLYTRQLSQKPYLTAMPYHIPSGGKKKKRSGPRKPEINSDGSSGGLWRWKWLIELYIFADQYDSKALRNIVIDSMVTVVSSSGLPSTEQLERAFNGVLEPSPLHKFLVDIIFSNPWPQDFQDSLTELPTSAIVQVSMRLKDRQTQADQDGRDCEVCQAWGSGTCKAHTYHTYDRPPCYYHEHDKDGDECRASSGW